MLQQKYIAAVKQLVKQSCTGESQYVFTNKSFSTGKLCHQSPKESSISNPSRVDHDHTTRRKYMQKSDFAHPKGLRTSISPLEQPLRTFADTANVEVSSQVPFPEYDQDPDVSQQFREEVHFRGLETDFPCLTKNKAAGPEPEYHKVVTGYKTFNYEESFFLKHRKGVLPGFTIAYETWGELNEKKDNAVLLCTGLSASSHAKSHKDNTNPGWWEKFIGPGCAVDTDKFFVICSNNLGGCYGTTGPSSINPLTGKTYGTQFPIITVEDMVRAKFLLLDHLGINQLYASIGSSLGGMQSLASSVLFPERVERVVSISGTAQTHPSTIALRYLQRKAIMMDPNWNKGHYYDGKFPLIGMKLAREIATITYRSGPEWDERFGRSKIDDDEEPSLCPYFTIENYIDYQGEAFATKYDPNSLIYISKAMDLFDLSEMFGCMHSALARIKVPVMVIGVKTDALIPIWQQRELAHNLQESGNHQVTFYELNSIYGHDTFLLDLNGVGSGIKGFLETNIIERGRATERKDKKS